MNRVSAYLNINGIDINICAVSKILHLCCRNNAVLEFDWSNAMIVVMSSLFQFSDDDDDFGISPETLLPRWQGGSATDFYFHLAFFHLKMNLNIFLDNWDKRFHMPQKSGTIFFKYEIMFDILNSPPSYYQIFSPPPVGSIGCSRLHCNCYWNIKLFWNPWRNDKKWCIMICRQEPEIEMAPT